MPPGPFALLLSDMVGRLLKTPRQSRHSTLFRDVQQAGSPSALAVLLPSTSGDGRAIPPLAAKVLKILAIHVAASRVDVNLQSVRPGQIGE